jgi:hypothetical protein
MANDQDLIAAALAAGKLQQCTPQAAKGVQAPRKGRSKVRVAPITTGLAAVEEQPAKPGHRPVVPAPTFQTAGPRRIVIRYRREFIAIKVNGRVAARVPDQEALDAWLKDFNI